jgi:hypothetical protein
LLSPVDKFRGKNGDAPQKFRFSFQGEGVVPNTAFSDDIVPDPVYGFLGLTLDRNQIVAAQ